MRHANPKDNWPLVVALVLFGLFVAVTLLGIGVALGQTPVNIVNNPTFDGMDDWTIWGGDGVEWTDEYDYAGDDGAAKFLTKTAGISQSVNFSQTGTYIMGVEALADDPDCKVKLCFLDGSPLGNCSWGPVNTTDWHLYQHGFYAYDPGYMDITLEWFSEGGACTSTEIYMDDVSIGYWPPEPTETPTPEETPTPTASASATRKPTWTPTPLPELPWLTENPYFLDGNDYWHLRPVYTWLCEDGQQYDPYAPCVRMRVNGEMWQTFMNDNYGEMDTVVLVRQDNCPADTVILETCMGIAHDEPFSCVKSYLPYREYIQLGTIYSYMEEGMYTVYLRNNSVGCPNSEIIVKVAGVLWYEQEPPEETPTPTPVATWIVPPSPTPRVILETPVGSSNIGFIQQQATLVIGWVGPALFSILFAAFAWATGVFQWLWSLATWLFSGAWRGES